MKQTKEPPKMIPYHVYYPYFQLVPANKKVELRDYMKINSLGATFQSNRIAEAKFIQLKNFVKNMHIDQFSKVGDTNVEDVWQQIEFLKGLTDLINSIDFKLLSNKERNGIVEEQKRLYNQLNLKQTT
jgi:hypothetical protein